MFLYVNNASCNLFQYLYIVKGLYGTNMKVKVFRYNKVDNEWTDLTAAGLLPAGVTGPHFSASAARVPDDFFKC